MLITLPDPGTMICETHTHTCDFHKQHPGKNYAGCTCGGSYGYRKKTEKELSESRKLFPGEKDK